MDDAWVADQTLVFEGAQETVHHGIGHIARLQAQCRRVAHEPAQPVLQMLARKCLVERAPGPRELGKGSPRHRGDTRPCQSLVEQAAHVRPTGPREAGGGRRDPPQPLAQQPGMRGDLMEIVAQHAADGAYGRAEVAATKRRQVGVIKKMLEHVLQGGQARRGERSGRS